MKTFKDAVQNSDFAVSAEIYLRPETDADALRIQSDVLKEHVDGILLTDNQYGQLHVSPIVAAAILLQHGVDPIVQMASRNRNRLALLSDLLGAGTLGVTSLLLIAGERAPKNLNPRPKPVLDVSAVELIRTASAVKTDEKLPVPPDYLVGGIVTPVMPKPDWQAKQFREKVDAGAQFLQTHICMNLTILERYMKRLVANKLIRRVSLIGAVAVVADADDAAWLKENRPTVMLPDDLIERLKKAANPRAEGIRIAAETIREMRAIPGIVGVSLMATRDLTAIPEAIEAAGLNG